VEVCSTAPARLFGLDTKGRLEVGCDADVVIYDPAATTTISAETHHMNLDHSAYEGMQLQGGVRTVMSRGDVIVDRGVLSASAGRGRFLRRSVPALIR
jgi:dihydropyrimidinase